MPVHLRRRDFVAAIGAIAVTAADTSKLFGEGRGFGVRRVSGRTSGKMFPAIAAASMPENLVIGNPGPGILMFGPIDLEEGLARAGYVELRRYRFECEADRVRAYETFVHRGIQPLLVGETGEFLFGFETLANREKAWRELNSAPHWLQQRARLEDLAIYKCGSDAAL